MNVSKSEIIALLTEFITSQDLDNELGDWLHEHGYLPEDLGL